MVFGAFGWALAALPGEVDLLVEGWDDLGDVACEP